MWSPGSNFEWDDDNIKHLKRHKLTPDEFEDVILNEPLDLEYQTVNGEERFKSLGSTRRGRVLVAVWTARGGRVRAITAYRAARSLRTLYLRYRGVR